MSKPDTPTDPPVRKTVTLPQSVWDEISDYRFSERIATEAESIRRLLIDALKSWRRVKR